MTVHTLIVSVVTPNGTDPKPVATIAFPEGEIHRHTLHDHDWGNDLWDWRGHHMPPALTRRLRDTHGIESIHGVRTAYTSPKDVGTGTNEQGRLIVYEVDYEVDPAPFTVIH